MPWITNFLVLSRPLFLAVSLLAAACPMQAAEKAAATEASERRLAESLRYLSSDEREGRGIGTQGLDQSADFIAARFAELGLNTKVIDGGPFQKLKMVVSAELGSDNHVDLVGPQPEGKTGNQRVSLKLGADFNPLSLGGSGQFDLPLVFAGYGITAKQEKYDDYSGVQVEGKAVIVMRHEPEQNNPHSVFNGKDHSVYAPFTRKVSNAYEHSAAAIVFITDEYEIQERIAKGRKRWQEAIDELAKAQAKFNEAKSSTVEELEKHRLDVERRLDQIRTLGKQLQGEYDPVIPFQGGGPGGNSKRIPVLHVRRAVIDDMLKAAGKPNLATLEQDIDKGPTPHSFEIPGWRLTGTTTINRKEAEVKNVVAVLNGEGPLADETVIIGAHYDHLGLGGEGSLAPGKKEVHNGADDNGSGTVALIEVARRLLDRGKPLPRRVVFIAFTGEERGLIGSEYYCGQPLYPLAKTVAMLNMDMVGRLVDDKLIIQGVDTARQFGPVVDRLNEQAGFKITRQKGGFGPSDHSSFYAQKIPVMHFFTGTHPDYHRPTDDFEKINVPGMRRVADLVADAAAALAEAPERPTYVATKSAPSLGGGGDRPFFGSVPDFGKDDVGYAISGVSKDGPAEKGGLKGGDVIVKLGPSKIGNLEDFDSALRKFKAGDKVPVIVKRDGKEVMLEVVLEAPR